MRTPSTDPDIRRFDNQDEMIPCPECRAWLLPLGDYELQKTESPGVGAEAHELMLWGWWAFVYNYVYDLLTYESRKKKLATLKQTVLPQFPRSLVCPRCLYLRKRA